MIKLIMGLKGTGKTKQIVDMANATLETAKGSVVFVEKGNALIHEVKYQARLVDTDEYQVKGGTALFGFIAGIIASDHDAKDIFVDQGMKICNYDANDFAAFVDAIAKVAQSHEVSITLTASIDPENAPEVLKSYI
ncbi:MAG: hypothetical protein E7616_03155 [Ruminococcaceae bacterium]|nr:hypothetical protein [Oscillospiraceae bacterium]